MFYSEAILSRRGPLAKVWLAAHMERKLSKTQTLQTDIEQAADAIIGQEIEVMALRLSGQLLLGVVRIYSRKAKYLLDDCNEALLKIKMAFRPGIVDMTEDQLAVNRNAITLQTNTVDLDILLPDLNWELDFEDRPIQPQGQHVARMADITLATADDFQMDLDDPGYGFDLGPSDGIGSQDFELDLGLDFGDGPVQADETLSVEVGRRASSPLESIDSNILGKAAGGDLDLLSNKSREPSEQPFGADMNMDLDMGFGPDLGNIDVDLGLDFGDTAPSEREKTPGQTRSPSRASSLTPLPQTPPAGADLAEATVAGEGEGESPPKAKRKPREKKQIIDSVTELADGPGARIGRGRNAGLGAPMAKDVSDIVTDQHFLPRSAVVMRLLEIREDPMSHFLPIKTTPEGTFLCAGPPGLAPELAEMFMRPVQTGIPPKRRGASPVKSPNKKMRLDDAVHGDGEVEQPRRVGSVAPSIAAGSDILGAAQGSVGAGFDFDNTGLGMDDFQMDVGDLDMGDVGGHIDLERARSKSAAPSELSRLTTPPPGVDEVDDAYADMECAIAMFDNRPSQSQTQTQEKEAESGDGEGKGYSKNTVKALGIIRKVLEPAEDEGEQMLSFRKIAQKATRRAASSFFFELLVLGTRDCIRLSQAAPFENIEVRAKDKLWERQRHGSPASSVASSMGL